MEERRTATRYPLPLLLEYQTRRGDRGAGAIVDITPRSARMELDRSYPLRTEMCLHIDWPVKLNSSTGLRLRVNARVIRVDQRYTIVEFKGYEFVTAGNRHTAGDRLAHSRNSAHQQLAWI